jgi:cytochrome c
MGGARAFVAPKHVSYEINLNGTFAIPWRDDANDWRHPAMNFRTCIGLAAAGLTALTVVSPVHAAGNATKDEAMAMVKKAVAFIKDQGADKAYGEISNRTGQFVDRDLYIVVYQLDGKVLAHGGNAKFVGKDMKDAQDVDGKFFVKERIELAQKQVSFWQDYKFVNPVEKKVEPKEMYCERLEYTAVCGGIYKN